MKKIGFIGAGHICELLIANLLKIGGFQPSDLFVADPDTPRIAKIRETFGVAAKENNRTLASSCEILFVCVRPDITPLVLKDLGAENLSNKTLISVTAGMPISAYESVLSDAKVVRILPNPPSSIGEGAVPVTFGRNFSNAEKTEILALVENLGPCFDVSEDKIDIFTSVTSPAPVYAFFEAMIDSAVLFGLDAETASKMVYQTIKGCLMMWNEGENEIHDLIVKACTPAGTSVESLRVMDQGAFRSVVKEAYYAAWEKSRNFGKR